MLKIFRFKPGALEIAATKMKSAAGASCLDWLLGCGTDSDRHITGYIPHY